MVDPDLLSLLCCPETHQAVRLADSAMVEELNAKIAGGQLRNRSGQPVAEKLSQALLRADGKVIYPIRNGIPVMLIAEAIPLAPSGR